MKIVVFLVSLSFFLQLERGVATFLVNFDDFGTQDLPVPGFLPPRDSLTTFLYNGARFFVRAEVTDELSGVTEEGESEITYYHTPLTVTEHPDNSPLFKPGFDYRLRVSPTYLFGLCNKVRLY